MKKHDAKDFLSHITGLCEGAAQESQADTVTSINEWRRSQRKHIRCLAAQCGISVEVVTEWFAASGMLDAKATRVGDLRSSATDPDRREDRRS